MTMKKIANLALSFPSDVSELRVKAKPGAIYLEVWMYEERPLITALMSPSDAYWLRSALNKARKEAKKED